MPAPTRSLRNEDYIKELVDYVKRNTTKNYPLDSLKWALMSQGHSKTCVERAIGIATKEMAAAAPKLEVKEEKKIEFEPVEEKKGFFARLFGL